MEGKKSILDDFVVDRISQLPDSILGHILSFLPTEKAVATSILSKRWKSAWVTVTSLYFSNRRRLNKDTEFIRFVNRVMLLHDGSLNKFILVCGQMTLPPEIHSWIHTAIAKNVKDLRLSVRDMVIPTRLFTCESLRSLELCGSPHIFFPTEVCLPRLKILKIECVRFQYAKACEKVISMCPILLYLKLDLIYLHGDDFDVDPDSEDPTCIISSASLRRLEIFLLYTSCRLKLKASSLEYFSLIGSVSEIFVEKGLSSLVKVDLNHLDIPLDADDIRNNSFVEAVRAFDCVKFLSLSSDFMQALGHATINLSTEFKRLVKLVAGNFTCSVQDFIQNSENLKEVSINYQARTKRDVSSRWIAPIEVPRCLSNSLKKVKLEGYKGLKDEREMIRYMLEHGSALEVMEIHWSWHLDDGEENRLIEEIREFPRKSRVCDVQFPTGQ